MILVRSWELTPRQSVEIVRRNHSGFIQQSTRQPAVFLFRDTLHACFELDDESQTFVEFELDDRTGQLIDQDGRQWSMYRDPSHPTHTHRVFCRLSLFEEVQP